MSVVLIPTVLSQYETTISNIILHIVNKKEGAFSTLAPVRERVPAFFGLGVNAGTTFLSIREKRYIYSVKECVPVLSCQVMSTGTMC